eukprot:CAMPEP_0117677094 /NCGR_PEP_ID=MMETSP0804-20121206/16558_1 /TAXON_ID=1074897 /ORGANISM="Tetraselmis astigmatica, Strain CCMP880" /LENGTH=349 /DNA_ID=CAMNT_0005486347 /DNA_START=287 /DNA_END=1336 /DNA_ORIENTATION=-
MDFEDAQPWDRVVGFSGPSFSKWAAVLPVRAVTGGSTEGSTSTSCMGYPPAEPSTCPGPAPGSAAEDEAMHSSAGSETVVFRPNISPSTTMPSQSSRVFGGSGKPGFAELQDSTAIQLSSGLTRELRGSLSAPELNSRQACRPRPTIAPDSDLARELLLAHANRVAIPTTLAKQLTHPEAGDRSPRSVSCAILIPDRRPERETRRASDATSRVIRRVPEPPAAPTAVTAPAVVQLLMASQAAAAAEQLRAEQMAYCQRNNMQQAYECQERLRIVQAQLQQLEADADILPRRTAATRSLSMPLIHGHAGNLATDSSATKHCDWADWYAQPYGNIAAADYCSGLDDPSLVL